MICNATPLILLAKINHLGLLKNLFSSVTIPHSVKEEVLIKHKPGYFVINEAIKTGWIKIANPKKDINLGLGKGENSAINLAKERKEKLIIDDAFAIKVAQALGIDTIRTTTVIFIAVDKKIINKKKAISIINNLIDNGYYISPAHYSSILTKLSS